eukprot:1341930-Amorphochlora_amoeboformis.AAC.1
MHRQLVKKENAHDDSIWSVAWTQKTNLIVTAGVDEKVREGIEPIHRIYYPGCEDARTHSAVKIWNAEDLKLRSEFAEHSLAVTSVSASGDGKTVAASSMDGLISVRDLETGKKVLTISAGTVETWTVAYDPTGETLATGTHSGDINIWSLKDGKKAGKLKTGGNFTLSVAYSPDGSLLAGSTHDGVVSIFDRSGAIIHKLTGHKVLLILHKHSITLKTPETAAVAYVYVSRSLFGALRSLPTVGRSSRAQMTST